ncbi:L-threonylcarbamoyladenylate synthase [Candidatus Riflebacteria bacterium]
MKKSKIFEEFPAKASHQWDELHTILCQGGLVIAPTDTIWGIFVCGHEHSYLKKVHRLKNRAENKPLILFLSEWSQLERYIEQRFFDKIECLQKIWRNNMTLIFPSHPLSPIKNFGYESIGIRFPNIPGWSELISTLHMQEKPVFCTSANISNKPVVNSFVQAVQIFDGKVDIIFKEKIKNLGEASTIVNLTRDVFLIRGNLSSKEHQELCKVAI